ncbi:MAG TPA: ABC transporter substrate-binding protein [Nocardioides sp.]
MSASFLRTRRTAVTVAASALALVLAACGSQLDPLDVAAAGGMSSGGVAGEAGVPGVDSGTGTTGSIGGTGTTGGAGSSGGTTGSTGTTGSGGSTGTTGSTSGEGQNAPDGGVQAGGCDGFKNQTGITDSTIKIGNSSDVNGPVPGIFESAQDGTRAFAAYFNASNDICGRKLEVVNLDSRADAGADQQAYARMCDSVFAAVGSMSAFDQGGAATAESCGLPDIRSTSVTSDRRACSTCFGAQPVDPMLHPNAVSRFIKANYGTRTALYYVDVQAAEESAMTYRSVWERNGLDVAIYKGIDVSEFNYAPYVQEMKDAGIENVLYTGPYQNTVKLLQAMQQQGFEPKVYFQDATIYDSRFVEQAGENGNGVLAFLYHDVFSNTSNPEMQLYLGWLQQVKPGAEPTAYGLYAWSAARLFVEEATKLGGKLTRASLVNALKGVKGWTSHGLHGPADVGATVTSECVRFVELDGGQWKQVSPGDYQCQGLGRR